MKFNIVPDDEEAPIEDSIRQLCMKEAMTFGVDPIALRSFRRPFIYYLNDVAIDSCKNLNLVSVETVEHTELPHDFFVVCEVGPTKAALREFEPRSPDFEYKEVKAPVNDFEATVNAYPDWTLITKRPIIEVLMEPSTDYELVFKKNKRL